MPCAPLASVSPEKFLRQLFAAAIAAANPEHCLSAFIPDPPKGRTIVIGAGKAAASMALCVEKHWRGPLADLHGLVITRYDHGAPCKHIEVVEAAHPVPDEAGLNATRRIMQMVAGLSADDLVLCLISGGGSALLALPAPGLTLDDKRLINRALLKSGATISEINIVRKHLSAIKGGRLSAACAPARVVTLAISDVPSDDPSIIASGPTVPDHSTRQDALDILARYGIHQPAAAQDFLATPEAETPAPDHHVFARCQTHIIATPQDALEAAARLAREQGVTPIILGNAIEGEARDVALVHGGIARQIAGYGQPIAGPCVILSGGETTVTVRGTGKGGRNAEFLLALAVYLDGAPNIYALAGDTDGIDGTQDNAGAYLAPDILARATAAGLNAKALLANNDGYSFFEALGALIKTGPTRTNVNDFRAIYVAAGPAKLTQ